MLIASFAIHHVEALFNIVYKLQLMSRPLRPSYFIQFIQLIVNTRGCIFPSFVFFAIFSIAQHILDTYNVAKSMWI